MPMPPRTRGTDSAFEYTRRPGFEMRRRPEIVRFRSGRVLHRDLELAAGPRGVVLHREARDVALALEDLRQRFLELRRRHHDVVVERDVGVPDAREHVGDGVGHHRARLPPVMPAPHHDAFVTPGTSPACTISRRQTRQSPKRLYTERARPHRRQRVYPRTLNFGVFCCFCTSAFFAISIRSLSAIRATRSRSFARWRARSLLRSPRRGHVRLLRRRAHDGTSSRRNGKPRARSSARPSSSVAAVVTMLMSIPRTESILS